MTRAMPVLVRGRLQRRAVAARAAAPRALHLAPHVLGVQAQPAGEDAHVLGLKQRIAQLGDDGRGGAQSADPPFDAGEVVARDPLVDDELDHRHLQVDQRPHRAVAALQAQVARVESLGPGGDVGLRVEALGVGEGAQRRLLARGIRIEGEDDLAGGGVVAHDAAEHRDVVGAERRAAGRDRGRDARRGGTPSRRCSPRRRRRGDRARCRAWRDRARRAPGPCGRSWSRGC